MYSPGQIELNLPNNFNVASLFIDRHLQERPNKIAIKTTKGQEVSYKELAEKVNACGNWLAAQGLVPGQRLLLIIKDCPEFFYIFWGAIKIGLIPVPLNTLLKAKDYQYMLENSQASALLYSPEFAVDAEPALADSAHKPLLAQKIDGSVLWAGLSCRLETRPSTPTSECFWLYSSGSTGKPKGAVHLQRDMVATSQLYGVNVLGVSEDDLCFSAAKLFFAYGMGNAMTFPLWVGATSVLLDTRPTPDSTFDTISRFKPSLYFGVPTLYAAQLQALEKAKPDLSSVRYCVSAGEALPADIFKRWQEKTGLTILDGIGSTEALHIFISNRTDDVKPGTSGRIVPGYAATIIDENGQEVKDGDSGKLLIQGPSTAAYYWGNPEKTRETMLGKWLNTGDTYTKDAEGYFTYCGRSDDMLKVGGIWTSPFEVEACLISHPAVLEVAIVGRADEADLIKPEAFIILKDEITPSPELESDLIAHCKKSLAPYKFPRWFNFVSELPKTATGKIQRFRLRKS